MIIKDIFVRFKIILATKIYKIIRIYPIWRQTIFIFFSLIVLPYMMVFFWDMKANDTVYFRIHIMHVVEMFYLYPILWIQLFVFSFVVYSGVFRGILRDFQIFEIMVDLCVILATFFMVWKIERFELFFRLYNTHNNNWRWTRAHKQFIRGIRKKGFFLGNYKGIDKHFMKHKFGFRSPWFEVDDKALGSAGFYNFDSYSFEFFLGLRDLTEFRHADAAFTYRRMRTWEYSIPTHSPTALYNIYPVIHPISSTDSLYVKSPFNTFAPYYDQRVLFLELFFTNSPGEFYPNIVHAMLYSHWLVADEKITANIEDSRLARYLRGRGSPRFWMDLRPFFHGAQNVYWDPFIQYHLPNDKFGSKPASGYKGIPRVLSLQNQMMQFYERHPRLIDPFLTTNYDMYVEHNIVRSPSRALTQTKDLLDPMRSEIYVHQDRGILLKHNKVYNNIAEKYILNNTNDQYRRNIGWKKSYISPINRLTWMPNTIFLHFWLVQPAQKCFIGLYF
jgi:hypothetical protein